MVYDTITSLNAAEVLARAKLFFSERVTAHAAFPEVEGPNHIVLRGQGGEEVVVATFPADEGTRVRGSTLLFDQSLDRFLSTLPTPEESAA
jgi:hypothetical protein